MNYSIGSITIEPLEVDDWVDNDDGDDDMCDDGDDRDDTNDALHVDDDSTDMPRETSNYSLVRNVHIFDDFVLRGFRAWCYESVHLSSYPSC